MSRSRKRRALAAMACAALLAVAPLAIAATPDAKPRFGFGKPASAAEIAGWDIDVRPDGRGLPPGRGTVAEGRLAYDAKCASCHGTFGESNDYMAIAGGVGTLASDQPIRTTGSKLNYATTLWDYINRAMPFGNPKTLEPGEVYALTAYVLHLNDILPSDGALDRESTVTLKLPNRDGFTLAHGMGSVRGKPDTRSIACMTNCVREVRLSSEMPEYARDAHGNLALQVRPLGPVAAAGTAGPVAVAAPGAGGKPAELARSAGCTACHGVSQKVVGPTFRDIGARYAKDGAAEARLVARLREGGAGTWGSIPMPPQSQLSDADATALIRWILAGAR